MLSLEDLKNSVVDFNEKSFRINGKPIFIYSGEIHYFRVPKELWEDRLIKVKRTIPKGALVQLLRMAGYR